MVRAHNFYRTSQLASLHPPPWDDRFLSLLNLVARLEREAEIKALDEAKRKAEEKSKAKR